MINVAVAGLGKMGMSHLAMLKAHPNVNVAAVCDSSGYLLDVLKKYTGVPTFSRFDTMLEETSLDAVVIATPSALHAGMVRAALNKDLHVFCEKPFCLDSAEGEKLTSQASQRGLVTQVGYHNRFVASFQEVKSLLDVAAIGRVTHVLAEAYGPVVLKPKGSTWRSQRSTGGGALYDYAAHPIDLVNWYLGEPSDVRGSVLNRVFSKETDDEVSSTLIYPDGATAQISVNWSDASVRKMTTKVTIWGTNGRLYADRQEIQLFIRDDAQPPPHYHTGWNVRYTTDMTDPVWFYLRGEEYSAQLARFVDRVGAGAVEGVNTFADATVTDRVISRIVADASQESAQTPVADSSTRPPSAGPQWRRSLSPSRFRSSRALKGRR